MRTETKDGITLQMPDELGFCFNPCLLVAQGDNVRRMRIDMTHEGQEGDIVGFEAMRGKACYGDIREYVQGYFDAAAFRDVDYENVAQSPIGKTIDFHVVVYRQGYNEDETEVSFDFSVFYIWGALRIGGETYNGFRTLTWFRGYPFTFSLFSLGGSVLFVKDNSPQELKSVSEMGVYTFPMVDSDDGNVYLIKDSSGTLVEAVFDKTFDMTFSYSGGASTDKLRINVVDGCDEGYYLRWIDRHGNFCYYLFKPGEESRKVSSDDTFVRNNLMAYDMTYGYGGYSGKQQGMTREDTVAVCAPLVDSDTFDMLQELTTSPCVDLYAGKDDNGGHRWVNVTLAAGTYKKTRAVLQDFICNIILPEVAIQRL